MTLTGGDRRSGTLQVEMEEDLSEGPADRGQDGEDHHQEEEARMEMVTVLRTTMDRKTILGETLRQTPGDQGGTEMAVGAVEVTAMGTGTRSRRKIPTGTRMVISMLRCLHRWSKVNSR